MSDQDDIMMTYASHPFFLFPEPEAQAQGIPDAGGEGSLQNQNPCNQEEEVQEIELEMVSSSSLYIRRNYSLYQQLTQKSSELPLETLSIAVPTLQERWTAFPSPLPPGINTTGDATATATGTTGAGSMQMQPLTSLGFRPTKVTPDTPGVADKSANAKKSSVAPAKTIAKRGSGGRGKGRGRPKNSVPVPTTDDGDNNMLRSWLQLQQKPEEDEIAEIPTSRNMKDPPSYIQTAQRAMQDEADYLRQKIQEMLQANAGLVQKNENLQMLINLASSEPMMNTRITGYEKWKSLLHLSMLVNMNQQPDASGVQETESKANVAESENENGVNGIKNNARGRRGARNSIG